MLADFSATLEKVHVCQLNWGEDLKPEHCLFSKATSYDIVLGSELVYPEGSQNIPKLLYTVKQLLSHANSIFILSYVERYSFF